MEYKIFILLFCSSLAIPLKELGIEVLNKPSNCEDLVKEGEKVTVNYIGYLGAKHVRKIDSVQNFTFQLGSDEVLEGLNQGIEGMCVGEKRELSIPHHLAFGCKVIFNLDFFLFYSKFILFQGQAKIPPFATVYYEVEFLAK